MLNTDNNNYIHKIYQKSVELYSYKYDECHKYDYKYLQEGNIIDLQYMFVEDNDALAEELQMDGDLEDLEDSKNSKDLEDSKGSEDSEEEGQDADQEDEGLEYEADLEAEGQKQEDKIGEGDEQDFKENLDEIYDRWDYKCQNEAKQYYKQIYKEIKSQKANDVFIFEENADQSCKILSHNEKYIIYQRKDDLLKAINKAMLYQEQNNLVDYHPNVNSISGEIKQLVDQEMKQRQNEWYPPEEENQKKQNTEDIVKVRNIIHQSLQPYHKDYTQSHKKGEIEEYFKRVKKMEDGYDQWGKEYKASLSEFLWLPAVYAYSEQNKMYEIQGKLFNPLENFPDLNELKLELGHLMTYFSKPLQQTHDYFKNLGYKILQEYFGDEFKMIYDEKSKVDFSQKIHAIVKISEIEIAPQSIYSGQWHVEGFSSDNILYTCLYVIQHDENLIDGRLKFKRTPRESDDPKQFHGQEQCAHTYCPDYSYLCDPHKVIPLGSLDIKENLMIIFPNQNIHKVKGIKNVTDKSLKRKIIAFFIVNHEDQPFTINDVEFTKPLEFIKEYRMRDMYERSKNKQTHAQAFNYCEH